MADLDFSHNVSEVPAGESLPQPYHREAQVETTPFADLQSSITNYADSTNWMSSIGANVASRASTAIAQKLGSELGKNPQGSIGVPLTDFDKTMHDSYNTQSQATLGLQANKLITDSNIELAKMPRLSPDLITKTNQSISAGLKKIIDNAPPGVKDSLESHYGNVQLEQTTSLTDRMIREQKEDQRENTVLSSNTLSENAYSFGLNNNEKAGLAAIETVKKLNDASVNAKNGITPEQAKENVDAARKSYLSGKVTGEYEKKRREGKGEEYLRSLADKKPSYLSDKDYPSVVQNLMQHVNQQEALRNQDQQLRMSQFATNIALDPMSPDMASQLQELKQNLTPEQYQKSQLHYISAVKTFNKEQGETNNALTSWNDPSAFARLSDKGINKGYDMMVNHYVQQRESQGMPITHEDAEVQVAATAGGKVPVFVNTIKNKLNSGNPAMMDSAARQIDQLYSMNASHALGGISDNDKAIYSQFKSLRDALPPEEAAKIAIQNANQDPDTQKMNKEKWVAFVKTQTYSVMGTTSPQDWALKQVGMNKNDFMNPGIANEYGNLVYQKYGAFYQMTNGDKDNALKLTKQEVKENFGDTGVNGGSFKTLHPIEKVLGYAENSDVVPVIQQNVISKLNMSFTPLKEAFNKNESNSYWEVIPGDMKNKAHVYGHDYDPIQVKRYTKTATGTKTDKYNVMLIGNSFNWDIALQTASGIRPLIQVAPYLGIHTYTPNKKEIDTAYMKAHGNK